jgi:superfamily I DNA and/or RNA helicase
VRANEIDDLVKSLGFTDDKRRINVAITRPKYFLYIVGNAQTLQKS